MMMCAHHALAEKNKDREATMVVDGYSLCADCGIALMLYLASEPDRPELPPHRSRDWLVIIDQRGFV